MHQAFADQTRSLMLAFVGSMIGFGGVALTATRLVAS